VVDFWVTKLREQAAQIAAGEYEPGEPAFTRGPPGVFELSQDLDQLARLLAEREEAHRALSHEVHHRVKNNLQIVTSLVSMQVKAARVNEVRAALGQAHARIGALALIHRLLYEQSELEDCRKIDSARLVRELCAQFRLWNGERTEIVFSCEAAAAMVPHESAMPLALFAVEAVTNAYAHAFPDGQPGKITLKHSVSDSGAGLLSITDDGIGFAPSGDTGEVGMQLMRGFAQQLGGTLEIVSQAGAGAQVQLAYPAPV
jgi:two-component sensor histidine kinase